MGPVELSQKQWETIIHHLGISLIHNMVDQLMALSHIDGPRLKAEARFIANRLEALRYNGQISNDAYLDAGSIWV